ncbi:selenium cofactor biosynthesis protein YqeC [Acetobacterium malicum]|uniref:selenium cofactor biosynthesis protein YqeC n=1 Tax=Acetobacterium malicum TaxID=52692 RepID=UPI00040250E8|nr:selenium cofactor biosynthesis protein YqeC [Acetobacterium dehalogenans]
MKLIDKLNITANDVITITGGGGKTALMFALSQELADQKLNHVMTTTAKICIADVPEPQCLIRSEMTAVIAAITKDPQRAWLIGKERVNGQKISGFSEAELIDLKAAIVPLVIINEGDGSKRKPYKFYHDYEPSILSITTKLIHVMGAEILFRKIDADTFHRAELYNNEQNNNDQAVFDEAVLQQTLATFIDNKLNQTLAHNTTRILFINKADGDNLTNARLMAKIGAPLFDHCLLGSIKEGWVEQLK